MGVQVMHGSSVSATWRGCRALVVLAAWSLVPALARAQTVDTTLWVTDGGVSSLARAGSTLYVGGGFTRLGPATGGGLPLGMTSAAPVPPFAKVAGTVNCVIPDGSRGWYLGGTFLAVGGVPRLNLAHVLSDGSVAAWAPAPDSAVAALALSGSTLYVGGTFDHVGGQARSKLAALDVTTGLATAWAPNPLLGGGYPSVLALATSGTIVLVAGRFSTIGGQARRGLAAIDASSGLVTAWDPDPNGYCVTLLVNGAKVFVSGGFSSIGGQARGDLAAIDLGTGLATAWNPGANGAVTSMALGGGTLYAGGAFTSIGGQPRNYIAAIDTATGLATSWDPDAQAPAWPFGQVQAVAVSGSTVLAGGLFTSIGGLPRNHLAALDATTGMATVWDPDPNGNVYALAVNDSTVFAGGSFTFLGGVRRNGLAALDLATGMPTAWDPNPTGTGPSGGTVLALATDGTTVYAGGYFDHVGGQPRSAIAAIDAASGLPTTWDPDAIGPSYSPATAVTCLALEGSTLYAGGYFATIGGAGRSTLAALDTGTGLATPWAPVTSGGPVNQIVADGPAVFVASQGGFWAFDPTSAAPLWSDGLTAYSVARLGSSAYVSGYFSIVGGQPRNWIAAVDATSGVVTPWNPAPDGRVNHLASSGSTILVGGWFSRIGEQPRSRIAELDATTGLATAWDPQANGEALAFLVNGPTVYVGGGFTAIGNQASGGLAALVSPGTTRVPGGPTTSTLALAQSLPNPADASTSIGFSLPAAMAIRLAVFDLQGRRVETLIDSANHAAGAHRVTLNTSLLRPGVYLYRLETPRASLSRKLVVAR
jgi:hypothetical protein